jgi:hypothetical protein
MTSRESTRLLALPESGSGTLDPTMSDIAWRLAFGAVNWPFLAVSLWGGTKASKRRLLARVGLPDDALPNLGSWKADTGFLHRIVDAIETLRPQVVVELGAGASSLVCARALALNGGGRLVSYDQHAGFVSATADWLRDEGAHAELRHAPLSRRVPGWPGRWYALEEVPDTIDLLIIDGPPWAIHPIGRGAAECLFDRLSPGGMVLLDDAARPGERIVARRWRENWPDMEFSRLPGSTKGTLLGVKKRYCRGVRGRSLLHHHTGAGRWQLRRWSALAGQAMPRLVTGRPRYRLPISLMRRRNPIAPARSGRTWYRSLKRCGLTDRRSWRRRGSTCRNFPPGGR